ncbi:ABC-type transport auxiliary lipoprotein family protein [Thioflexithrix psekupsensis]|nr:ABC-type transport auxiliary lipoprotein family protein [Thioflexithrix psekupsensis]
MKWLSLFFITLLFISGCSVLSSKPYPIYYQLNPEISFQPNFNIEGKSLFIAKPRAAVGFDSSHQVYIKNIHQLEHYRNSQWIAPPAELLLPLLVRYLEGSGAFNAVWAEGSSPVMGEWRLDTELLRLQQEFFSVPSQVRLQLRWQLLDLRKQQIVDIQYVDVLIPAPSEDALGGVQATHEAVTVALTQLSDALATIANRANLSTK